MLTPRMMADPFGLHLDLSFKSLPPSDGVHSPPAPVQAHYDRPNHDNAMTYFSGKNILGLKRAVWIDASSAIMIIFWT